MAFDNAQSQVRLGLEATQNVPAAVAAMVFHPEFSSTDTDVEKQSVANPNIKAGGHASKPLPGKEPITGNQAAALDVDGHLPPVMVAHRNISAVTDLGGGAYRYTIGRSQATAVASSYSKELSRDDGYHSLFVGGAPASYTVNAAEAAPLLITVAEQFAYSSTWATVAEQHPNPGSGTIYLRGAPPEWLQRPAGSAANLSLQLVDLYTHADGTVRAVFLSRVGTVGALTGTWTVTAGQAAFAGVGGAADTELEPGDVLDVDGQYMEVLTVTDANTFTTTGNHTAGAAGATITREYGAVSQSLIRFWEVKVGLSSQTGFPHWGKLVHSSGGFMGLRATAGSTVEAHLTASTGIVAGVSGSLTGTVSVAAADATVTGAGTAFLSECRIGDQIMTAGGVVKRVLAITSDTVLEADSDYDAIESGVAMTRKPIPTVALTGTVSTVATTALTGVGTAFDTELAVGSIVRTAGGEVRRIATITNATTATVTRAFANTEPGVAASTYYEYTAARTRADWASSVHASGLAPEVLTEVYFKYEDTTLPEELVGIAKTAAITFNAGKVLQTGIGSVHGFTVKDSGQSTGTLEMTAIKVADAERVATLAGSNVRVRLVCSTGVLISTSLYEYTAELIMHVRAEGKPVVVPDATTNETRLGGGLYDNAADSDGYTDALQWVITSNRSSPAPTS